MFLGVQTIALVVYLNSIIYYHSVFPVSSPTSTFSAVLKKNVQQPQCGF